jgi:hypothetical protein
MTRIAARRTLLTDAALAVAGVLIVGCSSQDSSSSASAQATSPASAAQSPTASPDAGATSSPAASSASTGQSTSSAPTQATSFKRVPMQTATGGEFVSPSNNISCEVDYHRGGLTQAYCLTGTPAQSVTMGVTGTYTTCKGQQCLSNAGDGTPTLAYGTETGVGPFLCESATTGVTCTTTNGRGFQISRSGITSVSG